MKHYHPVLARCSLFDGIHMEDLSTLLDCIGKPGAFRQVFCIGGVDAVTNADYFRLLGQLIGVDVTIQTIPLEGYLEAHPVYSGHLCNRCYDMTKLRSAGVRMPCTTLADGLREQIAWLETRN